MLTRKRLATGLGILLALVWAVTLLAAAIWGLGTSSRVMLPLMTAFAPSETTGLSQTAYPDVVDMITGYLAGERDEFQHTLSFPDGTSYQLFNEKEQKHMSDCRDLFALAKSIMLDGAAFMLLLIVILVLLKEARGSLAGIAWGCGVTLVLVAVTAIAAAVSFDTLFIRFHQLFFTNDLWLMDWYTDLIIRLMPTSFFISYAAIIGSVWAAGLILPLILSPIFLICLRYARNEHGAYNK